MVKGAGSALAIGAAGSLLAACGGDGASSSGEGPSGATETIQASVSGSEPSTSNGARVQLPAYVANKTVRPDLPGTPDGVLDGFYRYPATPAKASKAKPGAGGSITILQEMSSVPIPISRNEYWKDLNNRLGAELQFTGAPASEYAKKLATSLAGGDLPDCVQFHPLQPTRLPDILKSTFSELSEFIAGDAVKEYPALASIPEMTWKNVVYAGGLYGIPYPQGLMSNILMVRDDLVHADGLDSNVQSADDFAKLCGELVDTRKGRYAIGSPPATVLRWMSQMFDVPNNWREVDGRFTSDWESSEMKDSLSFMSKLWADGVIHPDAPASGADQMFTWFQGGQIATVYVGYSVWSTMVNWRNQAAANNEPFKDAQFAAIIPPKADGGGPAGHYTNNGTYTFTAIKQTDPARVKEILRVMDYLAAPFGTVEYLANRYGVEGVHYTMKDGNPAPTKRASEIFNVRYLASPLPILFEPGAPDETKKEYDLEVKEIPLNVPIPTVGLYSKTDAEKGAALSTTLRSLQTDVILKRKSLGDWDAAVKAWRSSGGDTIRAEYEASFAASR
jgi:putative aldouronate transport system substrate-binding protein